MLKSRQPKLDLRRRVLIEWVERRRVHQQELQIIQVGHARHGEVSQEPQPVAAGAFPGQGPGRSGEVVEAVQSSDGHILGCPVIVIPAYRVTAVLPDPLDARPRLHAVIDEIAQK